MQIDNRVTRMLGVDIPIVQAPMGWIARAPLASAVSRAGALGMFETSSGELDVIRDEIRKMKELTDRPFCVNIAQAFVRDPKIADFVIEQGVRVVTTSAGSPTKYTRQLKDPQRPEGKPGRPPSPRYAVNPQVFVDSGDIVQGDIKVKKDHTAAPPAHSTCPAQNPQKAQKPPAPKLGFAKVTPEEWKRLAEAEPRKEDDSAWLSAMLAAEGGE